ncbi:MAG: TM2 domain-containing protein [Hyphomonas sp.]
MALSTNQMMLIEQRVGNEKKSTGTAYLLWFFLGLFSAHRFYLGRWGTALLQMASYLILIGFLWLLIDAFLIPGMIKDDMNKHRAKLMTDMAIAAAGAEVA